MHAEQWMTMMSVELLIKSNC